MAFPHVHHLTEEQIRELLGEFSSEDELTITRIRYKNEVEIRRSATISVVELRREISESMETGWGSDFDVELPTIGKTLIGHHDGVFWLEPTA